ncbi:hypothetical protein CDL12_07861 [Handroanthus impetiginosus]|uniref:Uncharacterized protein n=1 Tax=Handroanthus impetiginosus TaxID=429701 RepID=A0A2G9HPK9_9LAMI|nr:hypothetical protein CDL12_07861 [Handroanthus impetiginosus]
MNALTYPSPHWPIQAPRCKLSKYDTFIRRILQRSLLVLPILHLKAECLGSCIVLDEPAELKKLDGFGRWMDTEIGKECDYSLMASDSANYWIALDAATDYKQVLIVGSFLGDKRLSDGHKWCCMFGETELCPIYVSCSDRLACSEVWEFEFLKKPLRFTSLAVERAAEGVSMQIRLGKMLCLDLERKWLDCSAMKCDKCKVKAKMCTLQVGIEMAKVKSDEVITEATCRNFKDIVIQELLKDKLYEWLVCKAHEGDKGPNVLDDEGQGVIHLKACLGPVIAAGVNSNFRDEQGEDIPSLGFIRWEVGYFDVYMHSAATKIQQKYHGWKGVSHREHMLADSCISLQEYVLNLRGSEEDHVGEHQVRKQYKKVLRSVSVVEKAILHWRRKKTWMRGFQTGKASEGAQSHNDKNDSMSS